MFKLSDSKSYALVMNPAHGQSLDNFITRYKSGASVTRKKVTRKKALRKKALRKDLAAALATVLTLALTTAFTTALI